MNEDVAVRIVVVLKLMSVDEILSNVFLVTMNVQLKFAQLVVDVAEGREDGQRGAAARRSTLGADEAGRVLVHALQRRQIK